MHARLRSTINGHTRRSPDQLDTQEPRWVYLELHPAKVIVEEDELGSVLPEAKAFVAFLAETGPLDPERDDPEVLIDHVERIEGCFRRNMADTSRYSFGSQSGSG